MNVYCQVINGEKHYQRRKISLVEQAVSTIDVTAQMSGLAQATLPPAQ